MATNMSTHRALLDDDRRPGPSPEAPARQDPRRGPWNRRVRRDRRREERPVQIVDREESAAAANRNSIYRRLLLIADVLAATVSFLLVVALGPADSVGPAAILVIPAIALICKIGGLYDRDEFLVTKTTLDEAPALFGLATLFTLIAFMGGEQLVSGGFGRSEAITLWILLFVSLVGFRWVARRAASLLTRDERGIIIGSATSANWLATKLARSHRTRLEVAGRVSLCQEDDDSGAVLKLGGLSDLPKLLRDYRIDRAFVAPGRGDPEDEVLMAIRILKRNGVYVSMLPSPFEVVGAAVEFDEVEGATLLGVRRHGMTRSSRMIKRAFDIGLSAPALVVFAPLMAVIAVAIKLDSRGPVFFRQPRMGRDDEPFQIFKFRTMVEGADAQRAELAARNEAGGGLFKIEADPRITRLGKVLRRTSLDELPQLINVVLGDMSLVGPRPLVLDEDIRIEGMDRVRLIVPPGVTGMWQILGSARIPMDEMIKIDYLYGANWSLWGDVKILVRTVPFVLARRGL
jgi:exopolysaccharide biosynthesis polyprenyl glycosylphosphotransferase